MTPLWSVTKVATYFGVEKSTVLRWIKEEREKAGTGLVARKINNRWKIEEEEVKRYRDTKYAEGASS